MWKDALYLLSLGILGFFTVLPGIEGTALLAQGDELMHIATVRDSLDSGNVFVPTVNGATNYHKPPLLFWMGMASESVFGRSLAAARLPSVILAVISVLLIFLTLRTFRVGAYTSFLVALCYLFGLAVFKFGRLLMMEQALVCSMLGVAYFFARYLKSGRLPDVFLAGLISAVSYLYKGPLFQFYAGLMLSVWAVCLLWRFAPAADVAGGLTSRSWRWRGRRKLRQVLLVYVVFHVPLIVPVIWAAFTYAGSAQGAALLEYFILFENIGKFIEANQPEGRLLSGWLQYSLPWTVLFAGMIVVGLRQKIRTPRRWAGWILFWSAVVFTLLHLLPNRKDAYYVLPAWPLALMGTSLLVNFRTPALRKIAWWNVILTLLIGLVLVLPVLVFGEVHWSYYLWLVPALAAPLFVAIRWPALGDRRRFGGMVLSGALVMCVFQFATLPLIHRPLVPAGAEQNLARRLCVVSLDPWDAFVYRNLLPASDIAHSVPTLPGACDDPTRAIITYKLEDYKVPAGYVERSRWPVWRGSIEADSILPGLRDPAVFQTSIRYYEMNHATTEARP